MKVSEKNIKVKYNRIHLEKMYKGQYLRFSTNLIANDENLEFVKANARKLLIKEWNKLNIPESYKIEHEAREANEYLNESFTLFLTQEVQNTKQSTLVKYYSLQNTLEKDFKHTRTGNLNTSDLEFYASKLDRRGESKAGIKAKIGILLRVINNYRRYFNMPLLERKLINLSKYGKDKKENIPFSEKEVKRLIEQKKDKDLQTYIQIATNTGMRTGEILALNKEDIDLENNVIKVNKTINQQGKITSPKTKSSNRVIPIINANFKAFLESIYNDLEVRVINMSNKALQDKWKNLLKELNLEYRCIYQMRHTFATLLLQKSKDVLSVSHILGHKNANITLDIYAKSQVSYENLKNIQLDF